MITNLNDGSGLDEVIGWVRLHVAAPEQRRDLAACIPWFRERIPTLSAIIRQQQFRAGFTTGIEGRRLRRQHGLIALGLR